MTDYLLIRDMTGARRATACSGWGTTLDDYAPWVVAAAEEFHADPEDVHSVEVEEGDETIEFITVRGERVGILEPVFRR